MHDRAGLLPEWALAELRRPVATSDALRERVMARIRADSPAAPPAAQPAAALGGAVVAISHGSSAPRRGLRYQLAGALLALAASVAWLAVDSTILQSRSGLDPARGAPAGRMIVLGDTVNSALHDTLRLVRFVFEAPAAARVAIAGDFNGWSRSATPLADSAGSGVWSVVVALDRESTGYAFVVDDTQWVQPGRMAGSAAPARPIPATPVGGDST